MKALAWKELREVWGITAIALGCYLALTISLMGGMVFSWVPGMPREPETVPFVSGGFMGGFTLISLVFAAALGFRQSAVEASRGTYLFLLHRPLRRETIFLVKLALGISVFLFCAAATIVLYGCWAATPGCHAGPFEWSMSESAWHLLLLMPLVYLGAFLSGLRPARWFGTRLLPLAAASVLLFLMTLLPAPWLLGLPLAFVLGAALVGNICFQARVRDYA
jgi:hypothetical protein